MISLIFTRKKLLVGISGKVTEFLEVDGNPFIEFGYQTPAETLENNLTEILNEYRYYLNRNGGDMPNEIDLSILYPNDRPAAELAQIQDIIRRSGHSLSIVHLDSLVLPYLYGMSHYDEIISAPCIVLEALDNYISLLYFHNPKKVNGSFLPIEENNLPTEYLKEKLSPQRLESMGIRQVFLLGKYLYNDFVLDFLENDLSLGDFIVRKNTSHLTDYKFMIKGSQRRMKDFSINPSERLSDWNKTLARIQIPISKKEIRPTEVPDQFSSQAEDLSEEVTSREDTFAKLSGKIDKWKLEITPDLSKESKQEPEVPESFTESEATPPVEPIETSPVPDSLPIAENISTPLYTEPEPFEAKQEEIAPKEEKQEETTSERVQESPSFKTDQELEELRERIDKQTELYDKMANSFEESAKRAQESMFRVRETEGEIKRLKKVLESKDDEVNNLKSELSTTQLLLNKLESTKDPIEAQEPQVDNSSELQVELAKKEAELQKLQSQVEEVEGLKTKIEEKEAALEKELTTSQDLKADLKIKTEELEAMKAEIAQVEEIKNELEAKNEEVKTLSSELEIANEFKAKLEDKGEEIEKLEEQLKTSAALKTQLEAKEIEVFDLQRKLKRIAELENEVESRDREIESLKQRLEEAIILEGDLAEKNRKIQQLTEDQAAQRESAEYLNRKILVLEDRIKAHEISLNDKDADLAKLEEVSKLREDDEKEKNSLKQELELLLSRYKIQQELLANKDQEFIEYKDKRIDADLELKNQITQKEDEIEKIKEEIKNRQFKHNDELKAHLAEIDELKSNVDSRDHKIKKIKEEQEKLVIKHTEAESTINDRVLELKALSVRLKVKELEVQELEQGLKSREEEINNLGNQMIAKNKLISDKEGDNQKLKGEVNVLKDKILSLDLTIKKNEGDIKVREDEIEILKKEINQFKVDAENVYRSNEKQKFQLEEKIKSLRDDISSSNEKIGQLETTIRQKEKEIQEEVNRYKIEKESKQVLSDKLLALNKRQDELKAILKEKVELLNRLEPELEKSKVRLLDLSNVIEEQRNAESEYKGRIVEQDKKLQEQDKQLAEHISELSVLKGKYIKSEDSLTSTKTKVEEHQKAIIQLNKTIEKKKSEVIELEENIKKSDDEIVELKAKLDLSTSRWADIGLALKGRDEHIIQLEDELVSLREVKKVLSTDLDQANFELHDAKAKVKVYIAERNVAEARANELSLQVKRLESLSDETQNENEELSSLQSTIRSLNKDLTSRDAKIQDFRNNIGAKEKEIDQLTKRIDSQRAELIQIKKTGLIQGKGKNSTHEETSALKNRLNQVKTELQVKEKELKELANANQDLNQKMQKLEEGKAAAGDQNRFQKMIEGKNEVIRALKIKLGEKDKELRFKSLAKGGKLSSSNDIKKLTEKLQESEQAQKKLAEDLEKAQAQLEDQQALRTKLQEMEKEMVVQRGRTKSRLEALEAELAKAFGEKIIESDDVNPQSKFQKTV